MAKRVVGLSSGEVDGQVSSQLSLSESQMASPLEIRDELTSMFSQRDIQYHRQPHARPLQLLIHDR